MQRRWPWLAVAGVTVAAALVFAQSVSGAPDRVHVCGRDYGHKDGAVGAGPFTREQLQREAGAPVAKVRSLSGGREIWASEPCGLGVFVRVDDDRFLGYGLIGGP